MTERSLRSASLATKLVLFSALLTAAAVGVAFLAMTLELRRETRRFLTDNLGRHQAALLDVQKRALEELLRASTLMADNPTLRAAMETYRSEAANGAARRDLLETIRVEAEGIARVLSHGLLVVTDSRGRVLAAAGDSAGALPHAGADLSSHRAVRGALSPDSGGAGERFSVLRSGDRLFQVGCVPIVLQDYIIGTLMLGDPIDRRMVERLQRALGSDIAVIAEGRVQASTLADPPAAWGRPAIPGAGGSLAAEVLRAGDEEYVAAPLVLGTDERGDPVTVLLLSSLTRAMEMPNRLLLRTLLAYGGFVVLVAALSASVVARSVLRPLQDFITFMRAAGAPGDRARRFDATAAGAEVRVLSDTFHGLMDSLRAHEERLLHDARSEMQRMARLQESEKLAALGRMLSGAAHEINNPLTGVVGNIEMLLEQGTLDGEARRRLELIRGEGRRIVALVRTLLKVARRDAGHRSPVDVNQVIRDMVALRRRDCERAGIDLLFEPSSRPAVLPAGELELQQVFLNVINNAYDALREGTHRPVLVIRTLDTPEDVTLVFEDNGPGMEDPAQVFEHFFTTKPVGQGTGLGLSISRAIVENHGGRLTAENAPGGGARFTVVLPRASVRPDAVPADAVRPVAAGPRRSLPASVLVVDDEPVVLELQMAILDSLGARATAARSGAEAIEHLRRQEFDLIVSDLNLGGGVGGEDLYEWVGVHRRSGSRGFLFVTGEPGTEASIVQRLKLRAVVKPFTMDEYVAALHEAWEALKHAA